MSEAWPVASTSSACSTRFTRSQFELSLSHPPLTVCFVFTCRFPGSLDPLGTVVVSVGRRACQDLTVSHSLTHRLVFYNGIDSPGHRGRNAIQTRLNDLNAILHQAKRTRQSPDSNARGRRQEHNKQIEHGRTTTTQVMRYEPKTRRRGNDDANQHAQLFTPTLPRLYLRPPDLADLVVRPRDDEERADEPGGRGSGPRGLTRRGEGAGRRETGLSTDSSSDSSDSSSSDTTTSCAEGKTKDDEGMDTNTS